MSTPQVAALSAVCAELLRPDEIEAALAGRSVIYLPLGSIEYHSRHLPIGLDGLTAHGVCTRSAVRTGGVVLPTLWYGTGGTHTGYPWTIMVGSAAPLRELIETSLRRLDELQVDVAVLFTGHFADEQLDLIDTVATDWNRRSRRLRVLPLAVNRSAASTAPDHAGVFETTLLAALHPDRVEIGRLPSLDDQRSDPAVNGSYDHRHQTGHPLWGVIGPDPRSADLPRAARLLDEVVGWAVREVQAACERVRIE